ncbi:hypothetical protein C8R45DRAFT_1109540 [Mycena sanguinolenta]|nr:hypothetical protein C8R45DRAFT_1109540 [Mycena sanguinolenta]
MASLAEFTHGGHLYESDLTYRTRRLMCFFTNVVLQDVRYRPVTMPPHSARLEAMVVCALTVPDAIGPLLLREAGLAPESAVTSTIPFVCIEQVL